MTRTLLIAALTLALFASCASSPPAAPAPSPTPVATSPAATTPVAGGVELIVIETTGME